MARLHRIDNKLVFDPSLLPQEITDAIDLWEEVARDTRSRGQMRIFSRPLLSQAGELPDIVEEARENKA